MFDLMSGNAIKSYKLWSNDVFIEQMIVKSFRHIRDVSFGPFRKPTELSELIVLAGPNGGGKSSILELLSYGLASRYSWQYYQSRKITEHSFAIKVGLTESEMESLERESKNEEALDHAHKNRGYWTSLNMPDFLDGKTSVLNERVHGLVSKRFQNFSRKLGFFLRSDRAYTGRNYDQRNLFQYKRRVLPQHFNSISYAQTTVQFHDMYDFLIEQSYHYIYGLGQYTKSLDSGKPIPKPEDPLSDYNDLLAQLFPGYSFIEAQSDNLSLRVRIPTGDIIPFQDLSSGEKEVFFILSFFIRHNVTDSVIVIDEPDLHLHPELARKLLRIMRRIRPGNQIWCATHCAELVDEAGRERTFFLRMRDDHKQAECLPATREGAEIQTLRDMFGYAGYVGISRKVVFTEGVDSSADRKTFTRLFPAFSENIKIIAVGTVGNLYRINRAILSLLESDFARCEFYLIRDRDYLSDAGVEEHQTQAANRLFILSRYHIENYLLDEDAIADVLKKTFQKDVSTSQIAQDLVSIARDNSAAFLRDLVAYRLAELYQPEDFSIGAHSSGQSAVNGENKVNIKVVDALKISLLDRFRIVTSEVSSRVSATTAEHIFDTCLEEVHQALTDGSNRWKELFPGRYILQRFSAKHNLGDWPALQNLLIERLAKGDIAVDSELQTILSKIAE